MNFLKKNAYLFLAVLGVTLFSVMPEAFAQIGQDQTTSGTVFATVMTKGSDVFQNVRSVIFLVGGFGLVTLAFFAVFGKLKWTWFASLAVGLAILSAAGAIIDYVTTDTGSGSFAGTNYMGDTLTGTSTGS